MNIHIQKYYEVSVKSKGAKNEFAHCWKYLNDTTAIGQMTYYQEIAERTVPGVKYTVRMSVGYEEIPVVNGKPLPLSMFNIFDF